MSCGEPTQHPELYAYLDERRKHLDSLGIVGGTGSVQPTEEEISENTELQLFLKALDMTPTSVIMRNGMVDKKEVGWFAGKVTQNYKAIVKAWQERDG